MTTIPKIVEFSDEIMIRVKRLNEEGNAICEKIKAAERLLKTVPTQDTISGPLTWNSKTKRIMYEEKPLLECSFADRVRVGFRVDSLIDEVISNSEDLLRSVT